ncbi:uncharacterized protein K02A2.6-like [Wyeomyia smithii]|uniref:uncharacterized protein K02A2.6-like n=1 Tax=Wyeomyia smithii TaxID=174621 RepID=UPI002467EE61|nr:uncharacterized protein K02A2.6-like [Wyeomyia smithii]
MAENNSGAASNTGGSQQQPRDISEAVMRILSNQQMLMQQLSRQLVETHVAVQNLSRDESVLDSLSSNMVEFVYDKNNGHTFDAWFSRYVDLFDKDAARIDDAAKVRLLLRKLSPQDHERYNSFILPKQARGFSFEETIQKLKSLFGATVSIFRRRYHCFQTIKEDGDDYLAYSCKVNKACVDFKLSELTEEQFKCLIYICGLKSKNDTEIRMRLINKLNDAADLTLQQVVEQCNSSVNLKQDTVLVENPSSVVNAVTHTKRFKPRGVTQSSANAGGSREQPRTPCWACGGMHYNKDCGFRDHKCHKCGKHGHKEGYCACFSSAKYSANRANSRDSKKKKWESSTKTITVQKVSQGRRFVNLRINNVPLRLQLDTGSDITIISYRSWVKLGRPKTAAAVCSAKTASGDPLQLTSELQCNITLNGITKRGKCLIADPNAHLDILGIDWLNLFELWNRPIASYCKQVTSQQSRIVSELQSRFPEVFTDTLGFCNKTPIKLVLKGTPKPVFRPKRPVAYSMQSVVEDELNRLQSLGILKKVDFADWAAPIVVVRKPNGTVRICADFSTGLNNALESNQYPLPLPENIFAKMANCRIFSHIDLSDAYLQVAVDEASQPLLTINTHKGLFQFTRLSPGIKSAPGSFQQLMDTMLAGLDCAVGYLDDILVGGASEDEHQRNLFLVLERLRAYGFSVRIEKCDFGMKQVKYLGQILDEKGIRPDPEKVSSIVNMPAPHDIATLRSYLGAVSYYGKYVKEMRALRHPMDQLLKAETKFEWSAACQKSFDRFREILQSPLLLTHYNPKLKILVSADASMLGLGARIAHIFPDGTVRAICHVSRSLTAAESKYSQIEKEGLALIFAVTKFHRILFGRHFILETDHKPLLTIFGSKKGIPIYTANRLQRWALTLLLYDFDIRHVSTDNFGHADILSRLINRHIQPQEEFVIATMELEQVVKNVASEALTALPLSFQQIVAATADDDNLRQVIQFIKNGWPSKKIESADSQILQFYQRRDAFSIVEGCIMYGERVLIPQVFRKQVLQQLHKGHPGVERMRSIARQYVYWPNIDSDVTRAVSVCTDCASVAKTDRKTNLSSWPAPEKPWQRVHLDYAGPMAGQYYLILVDAFSKWPEVIRTKDITTAATTHLLRGIFARFGAPETLVTDNGPQFTSEQFALFCSRNAIQHLRTAPFHPQSNGLAERFVDTFRRAIRKINTRGETVEEAVDIFLQCYRSTPCRSAPEGKSPAELLLGRAMRTSLELLRPPTQTSKSDSSFQEKQFNRKHGARARNYHPQDIVWAKVFRHNKWFWEAETVIERIGSVLYNIWLPAKETLIRSHCNQLRSRKQAAPQDEQGQAASLNIPLSILLDTCGIGNATSSEHAAPVDEQQSRTQHRRQRGPPSSQQQQSATRQSSRQRRPPARYDPYQLY